MSHSGKEYLQMTPQEDFLFLGPRGSSNIEMSPNDVLQSQHMATAWGLKPPHRTPQMHVRDLGTVSHDQIDEWHSARDIVVLIGALHQGEIMDIYGRIHPWFDVEQAKDHHHHAQGRWIRRIGLFNLLQGMFFRCLTASQNPAGGTLDLERAP